MKNEAILALSQAFDKEQLYTDKADCWVYGYDNSRQHALPDAVVFANSQEDIVRTVNICFEYNIPLTARGRASGTTGAAVPLHGGVVLTLERMQKIIHFDPLNRAITVEPGVLNGQVQTIAKERGLFWAPDPSSSSYCSVGGNLSCNAAGPRSLKYGTCRENTLGLVAVTGTGLVLGCGVSTTKGVIGYDLTRLLIGSERTLGIISQATLKLTPLPHAKRTIRVFYANKESATSAIMAIMGQSFTPCGCEFIDEVAIAMIRPQADADFPENARSMLMIEIDGTTDELLAELELMQKACQNDGLISFTVSKSSAQTRSWWALRKCLSQTLRRLSPHKINEDVVVPVSKILDLLDYTQKLAIEYGLTIVNFGHAGNGNIHVNVLVDPLDPIEGPKAQACLNQLFDKVIALQGSLSGEHGVGIEKKNYVSKEISAPTLQMMKQIKAQFDPKNILNPGKFFPE